MKGTYWKLKGQADTITKMEEVLGEEVTGLLYDHFFYGLPEMFWNEMEGQGDECLKGVFDYLWGDTLKGRDYDLYDINSFKEFGENWIDCYDCMDKDFGGYYNFNPILNYILAEHSVGNEIYEMCEGEDLDAEEFWNKMQAEFNGTEDEDNDAADVCMWWFIMGVAYAASDMFKEKYENLKKMYESQEFKDNLANYDVENIPTELSKDAYEEMYGDAFGWAFRDTYEHLREQRAKMEA